MTITLVNKVKRTPPCKWIVCSGEIVDPLVKAAANLVEKYESLSIETERIAVYTTEEAAMLNEFAEATN